MMSRKILLLCLVAAACFMGADAFWSEKVDQAKKVLTDMVDNAIADFQHVVFKIKERAMEDMEDIREKAVEITQEVYGTISDAVTAVIRRLDDRINKLTENAKDVDITECRTMMDEIHNTALAVIANSSACVTDRIERGTGYVERIAVIADEVMDNLTAIGHEATECAKDGNGFQGALKALGCLAVATKDAVYESATRIPAVIVQLTKLSTLVGTLIPQLQYCTVTTSAGVVIEEANEIATTVEACVEEKMSKFLDKASTVDQASTPTPTPTPTPKFTIPTAPPTTTRKVQRPTGSFEDDDGVELKPLSFKL